MKKLLTLSLVVILMFAFTSLTMASQLGTDNIPVVAEVGPYAEVISLKHVNFGEISGEVGEYLTTDTGRENGQFSVESNTDVNVHFKVKNPTWITSPYKFTVQHNAVDLKSIGTVTGQELENSFSHLFDDGGFKTYDVLGAIKIIQISAQKAGEYSTKIIVTISK